MRAEFQSHEVAVSTAHSTGVMIPKANNPMTQALPL